MKRHHVSFKHAWDGIWYNLRTQPNFRIHLAATILVVLLAYYLKISSQDWLILLFTIVLVIIAEMINTALEAITDLLSPRIHKAAKIAKDTAAGMVLVSAILAIIIGLAIFLPYLLG